MSQKNLIRSKSYTNRYCCLQIESKLDMDKLDKTISSFDDANKLLQSFRQNCMTNKEGAVAGLKAATKEGRITVGIVEDSIKTKTYQKKLKKWIEAGAANAVVEAATSMEVARLGESTKHLVCYDREISTPETTKHVRCILGRSNDAEYALYVDTAFFDGGTRW